jgi:type IV secretory pathway VirB3-like protein
MSLSQPYLHPLICPQCRQIDSVRKVSALVDAGTSTNLVSIGITNQVSYTQTILGQRLSPPAAPTYQSPWGPYLFAAIVGGALLLGVSMLLAGIEPLSTLVFFLSPLLLGAFILLCLLLGARASDRKKAHLSRGYPDWQQAYAIWQQLYYCQRCDGVFLPGGQCPLIPTGQMMQYIYSQASIRQISASGEREQPHRQVLVSGDQQQPRRRIYE